MDICISREGCLRNKSSLDKAFLLFMIYYETNLDETLENLVNSGYVTANLNSQSKWDKWRVTRKGNELLESIIMDSDKNRESSTRTNRLAYRLKEVFPKGKKDGTNYYWADGVALIERRLRLFFKKYRDAIHNIFQEDLKNSSTEDFDNLVDDRIVQAATKYVQSFNGDYQYMRLLKYFIFKEKVGAAGEVEGDSELLNYLENSGQEEDLKNDWVSTLK